MAAKKTPESDPPAESFSEEESESGWETESKVKKTVTESGSSESESSTVGSELKAQTQPTSTPKTTFTKIQPTEGKKTEYAATPKTVTNQPDSSSTKPATEKTLQSSLKRQIHNGEGSTSKQQKTSTLAIVRSPNETRTTSAPRNSKGHFSSKWSEDDEIVILQGLIDYATKTGSSANDDMTAFYNFVKKSIQREDITKDKLQYKVRHLRNRYENVVAGKNSCPKKLRDLSKQVWGDEPATQTKKPKLKCNGAQPKTNEKSISAPVAGNDCAVLIEMLGGSIAESTLRDGLSLIPDDLKANLAAKCREHFLSRLEIVSTLNKVIFKALKSKK